MTGRINYLNTEFTGDTEAVLASVGPTVRKVSCEPARNTFLRISQKTFLVDLRPPKTAEKLAAEKLLVGQSKAVEKLTPVHQAQIMTYLRLAGMRTGLLINFNEVLLKHGIQRFVL